MKMTASMITQDVKSAVNAYLMARTFAEVQREKVDAIQREELDVFEFYVAPEYAVRGREIERITGPDKTWLMSDKDHKAYLEGVRFELEKAGYKIQQADGTQDKHQYYCPALVAESAQRETEHLIIKAAADMLKEPKVTVHNLLSLGLERYHEFIDLVVKLVVNAPGFQNPLTGKKVV